MAFLSGLCCLALLLLGIGYAFHMPFLQVLQHDARIAASVMFMLIGYFHLAKPGKLTYMVEGMLPFPRLLVLGSGLLEILLGAGLLIPSLQRYAASGLIILLVMMFPANIRVAVKKLPAPGGLPASSWYTWSRLLFQPVYILWVWWAVQI